MLQDALKELLNLHDDDALLGAAPFATLEAWLQNARDSKHYADPNAMALATCTPEGVPSVRIVLCKGLDAGAGTLTFFTNYQSRKGSELDANPRCAVVFHWPHAQRQFRVEGVAAHVPGAESDAYFETRPLLSRLGAMVSPQSRPIPSRRVLVTQALAHAANPASIARPAHWGGYRLTASACEAWEGATGRLHQRIRWTRPDPGSPWQPQRLAP